MGEVPGRFERATSLAEKCPICGRTTLLYDGTRGEIFCGNCGYVLREKLEEFGPEWRAFSKEEREIRSRAGVPTSLAVHDMGLSSVISAIDKDASGRAITGQRKSAFSRLRTWDSRSQVHEAMDRNMRQAFSELDRLADKLSLSDALVERAAYIYRKALYKGLVRGRSISALIAAALYFACRETKTPRTLKDIAAVSETRKKDVARSYRLLLKELDRKMPVADPLINIARVGNAAGLSERTQRRARELLERTRFAKISSGKDPMGLAAAALYMAAVLEGENKTQKDVAEAAKVTEVTIRNRYKGLRAVLTPEELKLVK